MNYYYLHHYFSTFTPPPLFNDPQTHQNTTNKYLQQRQVIDFLQKTEQVKIEQIQNHEIKIYQKQEVIRPKKIRKQLKALCPELIRQNKVETRKKQGVLGLQKQLNLTNKVRNSNSNLMRMFFRNMDQVFSCDHSFLERIISKNKIQTSLKKIEDWFEVGRVESKSYIRLKSVKRLFFDSKNHKGEAKVMRILLKKFLSNEALPSYLTSKKIRKDLMSYNLRSIRTILCDLSVAELE